MMEKKNICGYETSPLNGYNTTANFIFKKGLEKTTFTYFILRLIKDIIFTTLHPRHCAISLSTLRQCVPTYTIGCRWIQHLDSKMCHSSFEDILTMAQIQSQLMK